MQGAGNPPLVLRPLSESGDGAAPLTLAGPGPYVLGRASDVFWKIAEPTVSRRHASIELIGDEWYVTDLGSRQGTRVNGRLVPPGDRVPVRHGDRVSLGGWSCRCDVGGGGHGMTTSVLAEDAVGSGRVSRLSHGSLGGLAQMRLDALMEICRSLAGLEERGEIAAVIARGAALGADCRRALVVRQISDSEFEVLASTEPERPAEISRTLLAAASTGELAQLSGDLGAHAHSVLDLRIRSAFCAPIMVGGGVEAYLYLDTRGSERQLKDDALSFCGALAQLAGVAFERASQRELEERRQRLERDLAAARRAQELLMPERGGARGGVRYAFDSLAGRLVAGDLFDVVELGERRLGFFLGDVSGKGIGAAVLMAAAQSQLRTLMLSGADLAGAVASVNRYLHQRTESGKFVTLIAGVLDADSGGVELVDAGHGMCCIARAAGGVEEVVTEGGLPLGVAEDAEYRAATRSLGRGDRLVIYTDGLVEQPDSEGMQLGKRSAMAALGRGGTPEEDVRALLAAVRAHAHGELADDLTIAAFALAD